MLEQAGVSNEGYSGFSFHSLFNPSQNPFEKLGRQSRSLYNLGSRAKFWPAGAVKDWVNHREEEMLVSKVTELATDRRYTSG
jgi:hypothetical protein